jgi:hypothetical protein
MLDHLCCHLGEIPLCEYKEQTISLLKSVSEHALSKKMQASMECDQSKRFLAFNLLWQVLLDRDDTIIPRHLQE